jgi:uncharacterized protein (DUF3820 family)
MKKPLWVLCGKTRAANERITGVTHTNPVRRSIATTPSSISDPIMPFGKFRGSRLRDLDPDYLLWVALLPDLHHPLLGHILREMGRRIAERDQQPEREAVEI